MRNNYSTASGGVKNLARVLLEKRANDMSEGAEEEGEEPEDNGMGGDPSGMLCQLLGMLLAMRQNYHSSHWQVGGPNFYGDHQLFERLYGSVSDEIDTLAEKLVAKYGAGMVDSAKLSQIQAQYTASWAQQADPVQRGIASERAFQQLVRATYDGLKESGLLSLGMDDYLMASANNHETNEYLLGQRASGGGSAPVVSMLRKAM